MVIIIQDQNHLRSNAFENFIKSTSAARSGCCASSWAVEKRDIVSPKPAIRVDS